MAFSSIYTLFNREQRIAEAARLGFRRIIVSGYLRKSLPRPPKEIEVSYINRIDELSKHIFH